MEPLEEDGFLQEAIAESNQIMEWGSCLAVAPPGMDYVESLHFDFPGSVGHEVSGFNSMNT